MQNKNGLEEMENVAIQDFNSVGGGAVRLHFYV